MATPYLNSASKSLALKIFDPVDSGLDGGKIFSAEQRLGYLNRAYGRLVRTLEVLHQAPHTIMKNYYKIVEFADLVDPGASPSIALTEPYKVNQLYYAKTDVTPNKRATYIKPEEYLDTKLGLNVNYEPTTDNRYWTIIDDKIYLLPGSVDYYNPTVFCRDSFADLTYGGSDDLPFRGDFLHILINMAAQEAMSDKGAGRKFELYASLIKQQLDLLSLEKGDENQTEDEGGK